MQQLPRPKRLSVWHAGVALVLIAFALSTTPLKADYDGLLHVYMLDIGQGDAIFVVTPSGRQILIDGGPDDTVLTRLGEYMSPWDRSIDAVIVSHPHSDHIAGLIGVLGRYQIDRIIEAGEAYDSPQFRAWRTAVASEQAEHVDAVAGEVLDMGDGVKLRVLSPFSSVGGTTTKTPHDDMVVMLLEYGEMRMLLTGDMESKLEQQLVSVGNDLNVDILKVGHHGSNTSTSQALLNTTTPNAAMISVATGNMYHLPTPTTLERLASNGIPYYRTDTNGTIAIASDGHQFVVTTTK